MRKALEALLFFGLPLVFSSKTSFMASNATTCAAHGCPNLGRCTLTENLAVLATRKQLGSRKWLSFKFEPGRKICADHTLDVMAHVYQRGLNSANPKVANLLSDVSAFFDHVEIGLTREEVQATKDADAPADDSLSLTANRRANKKIP